MKINFKYALWAILLAVSLAYFFVTGLPDGRLHVYALNVGQGDALLIRTPSDKFILVDGGPDDSVLNELAEVMPFYRRDLALIILTHPHPDHVNGLVEVVKRYAVGRVVLTGIDYEYAGYTSFLETVAEKKIPLIFTDGEDIRIGGGDVLLDMVFPLNSLQGQTFINANNSSIVFRLVYGKTSFLFEGDCELQCEEKILADGTDLSADVLKVGHHGSRTSSSDHFLDAVFSECAACKDEPGNANGLGFANGLGGNSEQAGAQQQHFALISVGADNRFKHPHPETVEKLQGRGVQILRTDINGRVEFVSDGETVSVR